MIGVLRDIFETCTAPVGEACSAKMSVMAACGENDHYESSEDLPETNELGSREDLLCELGTCARLAYGAGFIDRELWGMWDPPLNGENWRVVDQVCETMNSQDRIQAGLYVRDGCAAAIVAYRGTVSLKGLLQDMALGLPFARLAVKKAVKEACSFYRRCAAYHPDKHIYITGHSLGGYIAEAAASYVGADGAVFNSPGPWSVNPLKNSAGWLRGNFEVHLTRDDPLAFAFFPKPESSHHICKPIWHPGNNHRVCRPYMKEIEEMQGIHPNGLPIDRRTTVNQVAELELDYPAPYEIDEIFGRIPRENEWAFASPDDAVTRSSARGPPAPQANVRSMPQFAMPGYQPDVRSSMQQFAMPGYGAMPPGPLMPGQPCMQPVNYQPNLRW